MLLVVDMIELQVGCMIEQLAVNKFGKEQHIDHHFEKRYLGLLYILNNHMDFV
jgi:hypothetical protein